MGQVSSKGLEGIANQVFPLLATANLTLNHRDTTKRGYNKIYEVLLKNELLPRLSPRAGKSNEASEELRTEADQSYIQFKASKGVLKIYTKAICVAQQDSKEIALAYASRSAVTFELKEYDDSIKDIGHALAGNYSGQKSKLYIRRGKCYLALFQYSRALEDFKQAKLCLEGDSTSVLTDKNHMEMVDSLIKQCQNKRNKPRQLPLDPIKLSHPPSSYIQSASAAVDIKYAPELGRHIVASVDIKPGDVLSIEKPYISVLKPAHTGNFFCDHCKMKSYSTIPCTSCAMVVFCSEECRQSGWNTYHSIECGILPTLIRLSHSNTIQGDVEMKTLTALRLLNVASKCGKEMDKLMALNHESISPESAGFVDGKYLSDDYTAIHHLVTNIELQSPQKLLNLAVYATCLVHLLKEGTEFFKNSTSPILTGEAVANSSIQNLNPKNLATADMLFRYLIMNYINAQSIGETVWTQGTFPSGPTIASAISAFHSLYNHSCDPNVTHFTFRGDTIYTIAIQPIKKGQQVFEDYGYNYNAEPIHERQTELKRHYNFTCRCIACLNDWPSYESLPEMPIIKRPQAKRSIMNYVSRFWGIRNKVFRGVGTDDDLEFLSRFMILAQENVQLPWRQYVDCQDTIKCFMALKAHPELRQKPQC